MKRLGLAVIMVLTIASFSYGASELALVDNTLVTDSGMLRCLFLDSGKRIDITGTAGDTFLFVENGINQWTYTLTSADATAGGASFTFSQKIKSYKIDWSGTDTATLYCY